MTTIPNKENHIGPCESCLSWVRQRAIPLMGVCCEGKSDHFGHYLWKPHPACVVYNKDPDWPPRLKKREVPY